MDKYQFYISFEKNNTAGSKAIQDCNELLLKAGYQDYNVHDANPTNKKYWLKIFKKLLELYIKVNPNSLVAIQYPLLSGNSLFKHVIKLFKRKKVKTICIIHDLDSLRYNKDNTAVIKAEVDLLNYYDVIIIHNQAMYKWLSANGVVVPMVCLGVFDYLANDEVLVRERQPNAGFNRIAFAGNLSKSKFIYEIKQKNWSFNLYGPDFIQKQGESFADITWKGVLTSSEILKKLEGDFGLIWDGAKADVLDNILGNYLRYNNPHKFSLYLAAGLPVIAPKEAAIAAFISKNHLGILVNSLNDLNNISIDENQYNQYKQNVLKIGAMVKKGEFLKAALSEAESILNR